MPSYRELTIAKRRFESSNPHRIWDNATVDERMSYLYAAREPTLNESLLMMRNSRKAE